MSTRTCEGCAFWRRHTEWWTDDNRRLGMGECLNPRVSRDEAEVAVHHADFDASGRVPVKTWSNETCRMFRAG